MRNKNIKSSSKKAIKNKKTSNIASSGAKKKVNLVVRINKRRQSPAGKPEKKEIKRSVGNIKTIGQNKKNKLESKQAAKNKLFVLRRKSKVKGEEFLGKALKKEEIENNNYHAAERAEKTKINQKPKKINYESIERSKRMIMWSGVSFFMVLIIFIWIYNVKQIFYNNEDSNSAWSIKSLSEMPSDFNKNISEMKDNLSAIKSFVASSSAVSSLIASSTTSSSTEIHLPASADKPSSPNSAEVVEKLKKELETKAKK